MTGRIIEQMKPSLAERHRFDRIDALVVALIVLVVAAGFMIASAVAGERTRPVDKRAPLDLLAVWRVGACFDTRADAPCREWLQVDQLGPVDRIECDRRAAFIQELLGDRAKAVCKVDVFALADARGL